MSNKGIIIKNPDVISFYQQHPNINIETMESQGSIFEDHL